MKERFSIGPGDVVIYRDRSGNDKNALVVWVEGSKKFTPPDDVPALNLVFVHDERDARNPFGHTLLRGYMIPHSTRQSDNYNYWRMPEEHKR